MKERSELRQNLSLRFLTRSDTNQAVQPQKMARSLQFRIYKEEGLYYICCENKSADQLCGHRAADLRLCFRIYAKSRFSHDTAQYKTPHDINEHDKRRAKTLNQCRKTAFSNATVLATTSENVVCNCFSSVHVDCFKRLFFLIFAQNKHCGYLLEASLLTNSKNVLF